MTVMSSPPIPARQFDPAALDCFSPSLNLTDREVDGLLGRVHDLLRVQGESDQGHIAVIPWDLAEDLLTVAELLWRHARADH